MATIGFEYDHPQYTTTRLVSMYVPAGSASASIRKFPVGQGCTIKRIDAIVTVAGTNASAGYDIMNGTTSVGAITAGTNAAATVLTALVQDIVLASGGYLDIKTKANSATLAVDMTLEVKTPAMAEVTV